ncbi:hypothetical protein GQ457_10G002740 [Hibiscus cannabinus]
MPSTELHVDLSTGDAESSRNLSFTDQVFANKQVSVRLDDMNYLLWKHQVILMIRGHDLKDFLDENFPVPEKFVTYASGQRIVNSKFKKFKKQDSSLASWLLSTISPTILPQLVGAETSATIWSSVNKLYSKLSATKVMHLHCRLRALKKNTISIREYTTQIKEICDLLATITVSRVPYTWDEVVSILVDAEARLSDPMRHPVGINVTQYSPDNVQCSCDVLACDNNEQAGNEQRSEESVFPDSVELDVESSREHGGSVEVENGQAEVSAHTGTSLELGCHDVTRYGQSGGEQASVEHASMHDVQVQNKNCFSFTDLVRRSILDTTSNEFYFSNIKF